MGEREGREGERGRGGERQGDKDGASELEMEPHTLKQRPMNAAQRKERHSYLMLAVQFLKKGKRQKKELEKKNEYLTKLIQHHKISLEKRK